MFFFFLHKTKESINHLFYECLHAQNIWITIQEILKNMCGTDVCIDKQIVIFGCNYNNFVIYRSITFYILIAKSFIYIQRCQYILPLFKYIKCNKYILALTRLCEKKIR